MKNLLYLSISLLFFLSTKGCNSDLKDKKEDISIEYEAATRGSYTKLITKKDTLLIIEGRNLNTTTYNSISNSDWNAIINLLEKIDMDKISDLKAPSNKRSYDAARIANIRVIYKDKTYETNSFDEGNPPKEIEKLVTKITDLYKKEKIKKSDNSRSTKRNN